MSSFYLAGCYPNKHELEAMAAWLRNNGHSVTSRWLDDDEVDDTDTPDGEDARTWAEEDFEDIRDADMFVAFTQPPKSPYSRGGRHVELGYALGLGKRVIVVGPRENIFTFLAPVWCCDSKAFMTTVERGHHECQF